MAMNDKEEPPGYTGTLRIQRNDGMSPPDANISHSTFTDFMLMLERIMEKLKPGEKATVTLETNESEGEAETHEVIRTD